MASMYEVGFDFEAYVRELVATGRYDDERDVVRTALRLLHDQERVRAQRLAELEELLEPALAQVDAGLTLSIDEIEARLAAKVNERRGRPDAAE